MSFALEANPYYFRPGYPKADGINFLLGVSKEEASQRFLADQVTFLVDPDATTSGENVTLEVPILATSSFAFVCALSSTARAQRAEYVKPEDLPSDGVSHLHELGMFGQYSRVDDEIHVVAFALRTRFYPGRVPAYCLGLDGAIGGSSAGFAYDATLYPLGLGVRFGSASVVSLCGGARIDAIGSDVPRAISFPAELRAAISIGPIRPSFSLRPSWVIREAVRQDGVEPSLIDELEATLFFRIGRQHRYWSEVTAGGGPTLGVGYRGLMDTHAITAFIGFDFAGER